MTPAGRRLTGWCLTPPPLAGSAALALSPAGHGALGVAPLGSLLTGTGHGQHGLRRRSR
jgi:hypothetical protein